MKIVNLTQHWATPEQKEAGVFDLPLDQQKELVNLLTFNNLPVGSEMYRRATEIAQMAKMALGGSLYIGGCYAMIGGAPYFMRWQEEALESVNVIPVYAFSQRVSVEETLVDGTVKKTTVFKHSGFVKGYDYQ